MSGAKPDPDRFRPKIGDQFTVGDTDEVLIVRALLPKERNLDFEESGAGQIYMRWAVIGSDENVWMLRLRDVPRGEARHAGKRFSEREHPGEESTR